MHRIPFSRLPVLLVTGLVLAACGGEGGEPPESETTPAAEPAPAPAAPAPAAGGDLVSQGQQIFAGSGICFTCHGPAGQGSALAPSLADQEWLWIDPAAGDIQTQMVTIVKTGVSQPKQFPAPMPAMGGVQLTDDQVNAVVAYVMSLGGVPAQ